MSGTPPPLMTEAAVLFSAVASVVTFVGAWLVARRYQKMGGGAAQEKLNATYRELNAAFEDKIGTLMSDLDARDKAFAECTKELKAVADDYRRARQVFAEDVDGLRGELRGLRKRATQSERRADASDDRQDASEKREAE